MAIVAAPSTRAPQEVLDLRAQLSSSEFTVRLDAAAAVAGLPRYQDCPRPSVASSWDFDQWLDWGKSWGFARMDDTPNCFRMGHADFPGLFLSRSKSSKEYRAAMNSASDLRRNLVSVLEYCAVIVTTLIDAAVTNQTWQGQTLELGNTKDEAFATMRALLRSSRVRENLTAVAGKAPATNADREAWAGIPKLLKVLDGEFGISVRQALGLIGYPDDAERMAFALKSAAGVCPPRIAAVGIELKGLLEMQRDLRKQQTESKAAERAALRNQREAKRDVTTEAKYSADIQKARAQVKTGFATVRQMLESALKVADRQMVLVDEVAMPAYPGAPIELIEQRDAACAERDTYELERDALKDRVDSDRTTINRLEGQIAELQKGGANACPLARQSVEELLNTVLTRLNTTDIGQILAAIKECRAQAAALKAILHASQQAHPTT